MSKVIIDGIDVSECSYYSSETYPYTCEVWDNDCEAQNCYFKQLKRKEQECEKLNWLLETKCESELDKENAELKAENERLKETEEEISDFISDISTCGFRYDDRCPDNLDELQQCIEDLCNKFDNYKQALQEIREYCEEQNLKADYTACEVIDKINSVIGAEE